MAIYAKLMGNPFVDAGVCGICEWLGRAVQPEQVTVADLEQVVNDVAPIMQIGIGWKSLFGIFPNSDLTNSSLSKCKSTECRAPNQCAILNASQSKSYLDEEHKNPPRWKCHPDEEHKKRVEALKAECQRYLDTICELGRSGTCLGCGRREANNWLPRTHAPLTGYKHSNFFPSFAEGAGYCSACAFAIQFSPLFFVAIGGRFLMLHSNSWDAMRVWAGLCVDGINRQYALQGEYGCFNPGHKNPRNGFFHMIRNMVMNREDGLFGENALMQVYHFTNSNRDPELDIFYLSAPVFRFLRNVYKAEFIQAWKQIEQSGYRQSGRTKITSEKDRKHSNLVYDYLLQDRSIRGFFLNRRKKKPRGNWELLSHYLKEVRNMEPARLATIKQVGDSIAASIRKSGRTTGMRRLRDLEEAQTYGKCRNVLLRIIRDRIEQKEEEPLFSLEGYVQHLFISSDNATSWSDELDDDELDEEQKEQLLHFASDNVTFWRETRDLLLFRLYEQLHNWLTEEEN